MHARMPVWVFSVTPACDGLFEEQLGCVLCKSVVCLVRNFRQLFELHTSQPYNRHAEASSLASQFTLL